MAKGTTQNEVSVAMEEATEETMEDAGLEMELAAIPAKREETVERADCDAATGMGAVDKAVEAWVEETRVEEPRAVVMLQ